jgi:2-methylcitrate dehydratase PrpD
MMLAEHLARFAAALTFEELPLDVVASVRLRVLDTLGIALAASGDEFAKSTLDGLGVSGATGPAAVIGTGFSAPAPLAILANGALAHALDFDDTHPASITHASAVVIPTVLAFGEVHGLDGRAVIAAAVTGYESITRLGMAAAGAFHARGWHATSVCGPFAAALAAGKCAGLDAVTLTSALGIAGSFASGVMEFLEDGSWVKRVHPGWAGHGGAVAAGLAGEGVTGPASVLEGRFGMYRTFVDQAPDQAPFRNLGQDWETVRIGFKAYPCCHLSHAYLDCALRLRSEHAIAPAAIESVECRVPTGEVPIICEPRAGKLRPRTGYDAKFSLPYSVAAAFVTGRVDLDTYAEGGLGDPAVLALAARVTHAVDDSPGYPQRFPGWVRVRLRHGRVLEARQRDSSGGAEIPLPEAAIIEKFRASAGRRLPPARLDAIIAAALALEDLKDVRDLTGLCRI